MELSITDSGLEASQLSLGRLVSQAQSLVVHTALSGHGLYHVVKIGMAGFLLKVFKWQSTAPEHSCRL